MIKFGRHFIWAIVAALSSCSNQKAGSAKESQRARETTFPLGEKLYEANCSGCHGADGRAGILKAANLHTSVLDSISVVLIISKGKNAMPAFTHKLDSIEIERIAKYVFELRQKKE
jgi:mono/diheme cytochrome c family protein